MRHIGYKNKLCGTSEKEIDRVNLAEYQVTDFRDKFVNLCYNPEFVSILII